MKNSKTGTDGGDWIGGVRGRRKGAGVSSHQKTTCPCPRTVIYKNSRGRRKDLKKPRDSCPRNVAVRTKNDNWMITQCTMLSPAVVERHVQ
jgi:hypothetical protein